MQTEGPPASGEQDLFLTSTTQVKPLFDLAELIRAALPDDAANDVEAGAQAAHQALHKPHLRVGIMGPGKTGKSTMVSSLTGLDIMPSRDTPCSFLPVTLRHKPGTTAPVLYIDSAINTLASELPDECNGLKERFPTLLVGRDDEQRAELRRTLERAHDVVRAACVRALVSPKLVAKMMDWIVVEFGVSMLEGPSTDTGLGHVCIDIVDMPGIDEVSNNATDDDGEAKLGEATPTEASHNIERYLNAVTARLVSRAQVLMLVTTRDMAFKEQQKKLYQDIVLAAQRQLSGVLPVVHLVVNKEDDSSSGDTPWEEWVELLMEQLPSELGGRGTLAAGPSYTMSHRHRHESLLQEPLRTPSLTLRTKVWRYSARVALQILKLERRLAQQGLSEDDRLVAGQEFFSSVGLGTVAKSLVALPAEMRLSFVTEVIRGKREACNMDRCIKELEDMFSEAVVPLIMVEAARAILKGATIALARCNTQLLSQRASIEETRTRLANLQRLLEQITTREADFTNELRSGVSAFIEASAREREALAQRVRTALTDGGSISGYIARYFRGDTIVFTDRAAATAKIEELYEQLLPKVRAMCAGFTVLQHNRSNSELERLERLIVTGLERTLSNVEGTFKPAFVSSRLQAQNKHFSLQGSGANITSTSRTWYSWWDLFKWWPRSSKEYVVSRRAVTEGIVRGIEEEANAFTADAAEAISAMAESVLTTAMSEAKQLVEMAIRGASQRIEDSAGQATVATLINAEGQLVLLALEAMELVASTTGHSTAGMAPRLASATSVKQLIELVTLATGHTTGQGIPRHDDNMVDVAEWLVDGGDAAALSAVHHHNLFQALRRGDGQADVDRLLQAATGLRAGGDGDHPVAATEAPHVEARTLSAVPAIKVLAIDGGGVRAYLAARVCEALEAQLGAHLADVVDVFGGSSTGGILALGLAHRIPASELVEVFRDRSTEMFPDGDRPRQGRPLYDHAPLERLLREKMGDATMAQASKPVVVTAFSLTSNKPVYLSSLDTPDLLMRTAARCTAAAPNFFEACTVERGGSVGPENLVDGGVCDNTPIRSTLMFADRVAAAGGQQPRNGLGWCVGPSSTLVSIGTGVQPNVSGDAQARQGLLTMGMLMSLDVQGALQHGLIGRIFEAVGRGQHDGEINMARHMYGDAFTRLNPDLRERIQLDDTSDRAKAVMADAAETFFENNQPELRALSRRLQGVAEAH